MMEWTIGKNFVNITNDSQRVAFITRVDEKFVYGFMWSSEEGKKHVGFRSTIDNFNKKYIEVNA